MYQDLSFMKIPLPEDVLKLKNYGDYAGAQKMSVIFWNTRRYRRRCVSAWKLSRKLSG